jgi:plasmid stabilization system protein ParE
MPYRLSQDLEEIWSYVAEDASATTADRLIDAIFDRFELLVEQPRMGRNGCRLVGAIALNGDGQEQDIERTCQGGFDRSSRGTNADAPMRPRRPWQLGCARSRWTLPSSTVST